MTICNEKIKYKEISENVRNIIILLDDPKTFYSEDISSSLFNIRIRLDDINEDTDSLYQIVKFGFNHMFALPNNVKIFHINPFVVNPVISWSNFDYDIPKLERSNFIIDKNRWKDLSPFIRIFVLYHTIFETIKSDNPILSKVFDQYEHSIMTSGNSHLLLSNNGCYEYLPTYLNSNNISYINGFIDRKDDVDQILNTYGYLKTLYHIVMKITNNNDLNTMNCLESWSGYNLNLEADEGDSEINDDQVEEVSADTEEPTSSDDENINNTNNNDGDPEIDETKELIQIDTSTKTPLNDMLYIRAVLALNSTYQNMENPPLTADDLNILNNWCSNWIMFSSIDDTKYLMKKLSLSKKLSNFK